MDIWRALLFSVIFLILDALFYFAFVLPFRFDLLDYETNLYSTFEMLSKVSFYVLFWFLFLRKQVTLNHAEEKIPRIDQVCSMVMISGGLFLLNRLFFDLYSVYIERYKFDFKQDDFRNFVNNNPIYSQVLGVIGSLIIAPIGEELVFRKYLFAKMLNRYHVWTAMVWSSLCFALIHVPDYRNLLPTFLLGFFCSFAFQRSKKILYPIILHFLYNFFTYLNQSFFIDFKIFIYENRFNLSYFLIVITGVIFIYSGFLLFNKAMKKEKEKLEIS